MWLALTISLSAAVSASADASPAEVRPASEAPIEISGRYPHLAMFNQGRECGIGAVAAWADRLWAITYSPHSPGGNDDKLYEIDAALNMTVRPESVGGTPANRMIHRESNQLIIGPYFIDQQRNVRVIPPKRMFGRLTGTVRHLSDPASKVYFYTMEEGLYEVDVRSLEVATVFRDRNIQGVPDLIPGYHGKGAYTGQGRVAVSNNGERGDANDGLWGCLAEWDGRQWRVVDRKQYNEVAGPGDIFGNAQDSDPIWATGWDKRSVILKLLDTGRWHTYRLPIGSDCYVAKHGWFTEWPRIRQVAAGQFLMNMHGLWYDFPQNFSAANTAGLRPIASYLKITGDLCSWRDRLVFACDDASLLDNPLLGQSQSNLWFAARDDLNRCGRPAGWGGSWVADDVEADEPSEPYLFCGFRKRMAHLAHRSAHPVVFTFELDRQGNGDWTTYRSVTVAPNGYAYAVFPPDLDAQWIRVRTDRNCRAATAYFHYGPGGGAAEESEPFAALADADSTAPRSAGIIRPRGGDLGTLHYLARTLDGEGKIAATGYYEIGQDLRLRHCPDKKKEMEFLKQKASVEKLDFDIDRASVVLTAERGRRYRLPKSLPAYDDAWPEGLPRGVREVVTERSLLNAHGTFYVLPRASAGGVAGIKPVCTHNKRITDFCSWRGLLVLAGCRAAAPADGHLCASQDGRAGLWLGDVDDLWRLGKPRGVGGPWKDTLVQAGVPSDPYLMTGYDRKVLKLTHDASSPVTFAIEVDFLGAGQWHTYSRVNAPAGQATTHRFPDGYQARWVRLTASHDCRATAEFLYE